MDDDARYRALAARDSRFDGLFFVGVTTTGIYCRPVCRAKLAARDRCVFFRHRAMAERDGYRACFRCRPELAPGTSQVDAVCTLARAAVARIEAGALNDASIDDLAHELHVSSRHLRRAVQREMGVSPVDLGQTCRLSLSKQLLQDTTMSIVDVSYASGFSSVRRFNAAFRARFGRTPSAVKRCKASQSRVREGVWITLGYREPFAWGAILEFLATRAVPGVERVDLEARTYARTVSLEGQNGFIVASVDTEKRSLRVLVSHSLARSLMAIAARTRALFDLDADSRAIDSHLVRDASLRRRVRALPGLRVPGAFDRFELVVRAVVGQQITIRGATTIIGRLVRAFGTHFETSIAGLDRVFPSASVVAREAPRALEALGLTHARAKTLRALADGVSLGQIALDGAHGTSEVARSLESIDGIGPWTAQYIAMRALRAPDAFPATDLGLVRALHTTPRGLEARAAAWSPWRAYAAMHLWHGEAT